MSLIEHLSGKAALMRLQGLDSQAVKNAFFANYLAALVLVKLKDIQGLGLVNDQAHKHLPGFNGKMSDVCFWGRALFHPTDKQVKDALKYGHAELLQKESGRILESRVHKIIEVIMKPPEQVNWNEVNASLYLLKHRFSMTSSYFARIARGLMGWDRLTEGGKDKVVYDSFMYLLQSDSRSSVISRMRELTNHTALVGAAAIAQKVTDVFRIPEPRNGIFEDGEAGGVSVSAGGGTSAGNVATGASGNAIIDQMAGDCDDVLQPYQFGKVAGKAKKKAVKYEKFRKRQRKFKLVKFKAPSSKVRNLSHAYA